MRLLPKFPTVLCIFPCQLLTWTRRLLLVKVMLLSPQWATGLPVLLSLSNTRVSEVVGLMALVSSWLCAWYPVLEEAMDWLAAADGWFAKKGSGIINHFSLLGLAGAANTCRTAKSKCDLPTHGWLGPKQSLPLPSIPAFLEFKMGVCVWAVGWDRYQMDSLAMTKIGFHPNSVSSISKILFANTVTVLLLQDLSLGRSGCSTAIPISSHIPAAGDVGGAIAQLTAPHKLRHCSNHQTWSIVDFQIWVVGETGNSQWRNKKFNKQKCRSLRNVSGYSALKFFGCGNTVGKPFPWPCVLNRCTSPSCMGC